MSRLDDLVVASRRKAHELLSRAKAEDDERLAARDHERQAQDAKTERLRALRLAHEASGRAEQPAKPVRRRPATTAAI